MGPRPDGPFVTVDAGALPANLVEAELFGHEKGAFTGAERARRGAFERASGGTLFLDEIGELPLSIQPALLGVLQRRRFRRVGGDDEIAVDVRVVAATHRDLRAEVNRGAFRADLFYRLAGARIAIPPLRERPEDIPTLVRHFAVELTGTREGPFDDAGLAELAKLHWAGNVRELRSVVERALAFGAADVAALLDDHDAAAEPAADAEGAAIGRYRDARAKALATFERRYFARLIEGAGGNASEAARKAQMDRPYLLTMLRKYGLR
jgi:DNA-binding NtrC family response regulator